MFRATLKAWVAMLGFDPNDVCEIVVRPGEIQVMTYKRDIAGRFESNWSELITETQIIRVLD